MKSDRLRLVDGEAAGVPSGPGRYSAPTSCPTPLPETGRLETPHRAMDPAQMRQAARLGILDVLLRLHGPHPWPCGARHYQDGCACTDCQGRETHAQRYGYNAATGKLNPKPAPSQPWHTSPPKSASA